MKTHTEHKAEADAAIAAGPEALKDHNSKVIETGEGHLVGIGSRPIGGFKWSCSPIPVVTGDGNKGIAYRRLAVESDQLHQYPGIRFFDTSEEAEADAKQRYADGEYYFGDSL